MRLDRKPECRRLHIVMGSDSAGLSGNFDTWRRIGSPPLRVAAFRGRADNLHGGTDLERRPHRAGTSVDPGCPPFAMLAPAAASPNLASPEGSPMRIEIICTGDEVLTGKITNTNFSYMAQKLEDVGLSVHWGTTVGDDRDSLLAAFQLAATRADAVIVNGGLGPTVDDLSQEVAAQAAGVELVLHEEWLGPHGVLLYPPNAHHAAEQRQTGDAASHR